MTQHIVIRMEKGKITVDPAHASVWRDDQTIMWHVDEGLCWPKGLLNPIQFSNKNGGHEWPGTAPTPLGAEPEGKLLHDTRLYVALAQKLMPDGKTENYHYTLTVAKKSAPSKAVRVRVRTPAGELIDPDVENQAQP
jgi:hypothetical protein